jgi:hypothetical protein
MDWTVKALLAAAMVWVVMAVARRSGRRWGGVCAALPIITAPTLAWLMRERGVDFAIGAAVASVSACAMLACFSVGYALASRRGGRLRSLSCGMVGALTLAWPAFAASGSLNDALTLGLACSVLAQFLIPRTAFEAVTRPRPQHALAWSALAAGGITALATSAGPALGSFATGLLASFPVVSAAVAMVEHAHGGHPAACNFLHGYAWGLFGKSAFGVAFVLLAPRIGGPAALVTACACAGLVSLVSPGRLPSAAATPTGCPRHGEG